MSEDILKDYNPDLDDEQFKARYAGLFQYKHRPYISKEKMLEIWNAFQSEMPAFLEAHKNLKEEDISKIGIDKFVLTMGWLEIDDVKRWTNNKVRVGYCCHCQDQFVLMILQYNHGLCDKCRPSFSSQAIAEFLKKQMYTERYQQSHHDLYMDFFIMFYNDSVFRGLFLKGTDFANNLEQELNQLPEFFQSKLNTKLEKSHELIECGEGVYEIKETDQKPVKKRRKK
jgi:hypothetical protein